MAPPPLEFSPPLLNTACPWATDLADLTALYDCEHTGAVTTRTSLVKGFQHNPEVHQFVFFEAASHDPKAGSAPSASLNSLGYSPLPLETYLGFIRAIVSRPAGAGKNKNKGFVVSVTGGPEEVAECYRHIVAAQVALPVGAAAVPLAMEVNLSCPNIPDKPPPAYDGPSLETYLAAIAGAVDESTADAAPVRIPVGFKTPPYTHAGQFAVLVGALRASAAASADGLCPLSFLTMTNTLGSCLVLTGAESPEAALPGTGLGGMAGAPLHALALGNVATVRRMLDSEADKAALGHIRIIGAGGVLDSAGFARMKSVGAYAVGVGSGLGLHGVGVFEKIGQ